MKLLSNMLESIPQFESIRQCLIKNETPIGIKGLVEPARPYLINTLHDSLKKKCLIITYNTLSAKRIFSNLNSISEKKVIYLPPRDIILYDVVSKTKTNELKRVKSLYRMASNDYDIAIASIEAMCLKVAKPDDLKKTAITIDKLKEWDIIDLCSRLEKAGYERSHMVDAEGQFSRRGDILDIFSPGDRDPIRIEFYGDYVDLIRTFDIVSQRSIEEIESTVILPCSEQIIDDDKISTICSKFQNENEWTEKLKSRTYTLPIDPVYSLLDDINDAFSYVDKETLIIFDNDIRCKKRLESVVNEYSSMCIKLLEKKKIVPEACRMYSESIGFSKPDIVMPDILSYSDEFKPVREFNIITRENTAYRGSIDLLFEDLKRWKDKKRRVIVFVPNEKSAKILSEYFFDKGLDTYMAHDSIHDVLPGNIAIIPGGLSEGFEYPEAGLCFIGSGKIFKKEEKESLQRKQGKDINLFISLKTGDYVVHEIHGIGRYAGLVNIEAAGVRKDYLKVIYKNEDYLYIPVSKMNLIQKYIGADGRPPKLSKLGGTEWETIKKKVRNSVKELAFELVKLYAERKALKGHSYSPDTVWQIAFEEEFPYEETPDQVRCVEEIKKDMEEDIVMDRLLCGDVGFGKTEVALRGVFKAVMDGKQVAFLVPTTVLAYQHYNNFKERMKNFPVSIELLSRFKSKTEQSKTANNIKAGSVDVVVGTHRLLQKDITFKNLGLLVIDEEQRFGVEHKEKIKNLKKDIDVLTLTATPIPRTLHMSLSGIRDISIIEDPPGKRFPVQTYVMEYDEDIIKDAIEREKARGGQVFYLYNRVQGIDSKYSKLKELLDNENIKIGIAHGQMDEKKLEKAMVDFISGKYDILLCTTIIESGIDMPNVNTLIIEDADRMGLSQLYQIRGRVGRSDKVAYAYITYKMNKVISEDASKRLEAIREFTEFGSGFKIAMRDLEIRGAGNILGANQHGHMEKVGYDMYVRLLNDSIREMSGEKISDLPPAQTSVELNIDAFISSEYIEDELQRMDIYRKLSVISKEEEKSEVFDELLDRYGHITDEVLLLADISLIKHYGTICGFERIFNTEQGIFFLYFKEKVENYYKLKSNNKQMDKDLIFSSERKPGIILNTKNNISDNHKLLCQIKKVLETIMLFE